MSSIDPNLLKTVNEDLGFLFTKWNQDIDDVSLRLTSTVLRRLLIDRILGKAAGVFKMQIEIMAPIFSGLEHFGNLKEIEFYQCGGAAYKGMSVQSVMMVNRVFDQQEITKMHQTGKEKGGKSSPIKLSDFLKQPSFIIKGTLINREDVIKYVANKLGGAHYDNERKNDDDLERKYVLMDNVRNGVRVADKNAIYYELLSIGRIFINSRDVHKLRKEIQKTILQYHPMEIRQIQIRKSAENTKSGIPNPGPPI
jgi:hypothetical protein